MVSANATLEANETRAMAVPLRRSELKVRPPSEGPPLTTGVQYSGARERTRPHRFPEDRTPFVRLPLAGQVAPRARPEMVAANLDRERLAAPSPLEVRGSHSTRPSHSTVSQVHTA